jgi:hypothetical protein
MYLAKSVDFHGDNTLAAARKRKRAGEPVWDANTAVYASPSTGEIHVLTRF